MNIEILNETLRILICVFILIIPSSLFVSNLILILNSEKQSYTFSFKDEGTLIGILERLLIFNLFLLDALSSIGLIIATKTMVRYGQFEELGVNKNFRAKYLIGTLSSVHCVTFVLLVYGLLENINIV